MKDFIGRGAVTLDVVGPLVEGLTEAGVIPVNQQVERTAPQPPCLGSHGFSSSKSPVFP